MAQEQLDTTVVSMLRTEINMLNLQVMGNR